MEEEMEAECKLIMESLERGEVNKKAKGKGLAGRVWKSCVSCGASAVLESAGWVGKKQEQAASEKNRFVFTVCGRCERKGVGGVGGSGSNSMFIHREIIEGSPAFRAIRKHCAERGWDDLECGSDKVVNKRVLLQQERPGMTVRSVHITDVGEDSGMWVVTVSKHVEAAFV
jgi:hypothetical protein